MKKSILLGALYCLCVTGMAFASPDKASNRARTHFSLHYSGIDNASWSDLDNKDIVCMFLRDDTRYQVYYDVKGKWKFTCTGYSPDKLNAAVKENVFATYPGYQLLYVQEVQSPDTDPIYIVQVEDKKTILVLQVIGQNITVKDSLEKQ